MSCTRAVRYGSVVRNSDQGDIELFRIIDQRSPHERGDIHIPRRRHRVAAIRGLTHITSQSVTRLQNGLAAKKERQPMSESLIFIGMPRYGHFGGLRGSEQGGGCGAEAAERSTDAPPTAPGRGGACSTGLLWSPVQSTWLAVACPHIQIRSSSGSVWGTYRASILTSKSPTTSTVTGSVANPGFHATRSNSPDGNSNLATPRSSVDTR